MEKGITKGGGFLLEDIGPDQVFTPEDFNKEQQLIAKAVCCR